MTTWFKVIMVLIALEHFYFLILEMFLWTTKKGIRSFGLESKEFAYKTKVLAANQGLYNGFLAAGVLYSLFKADTNVAVFFLICITIAGIYGAFSTKNIRLFYIQSIPAIFAISLLYLT